MFWETSVVHILRQAPSGSDVNSGDAVGQHFVGTVEWFPACATPMQEELRRHG